MDTMMTVTEVAKRLKISRAHGYLLIREKGFPLIELGERTLRIDPTALELWLDKKERRN
jgi:excisionase family DNA binding protein